MRRRASGSGAEDDDGIVSTTYSSTDGSAGKSKDVLMDTEDSKSSRESSSDESRPEDDDDDDREITVAKKTTTTWDSLEKKAKTEGTTKATSKQEMNDFNRKRRARLRSPWACSLSTLSCSAVALLLLFVIVQSFLSRQLDPKGCAMSYMRAAFAKFTDFDTEHTRFASKYSLYLYREGGIDEDTRVKGIPVLFIPGNAGSYKQVRPIAAEAAYYFHDFLQHDENALRSGKRALDFFSVDFNEDITAFHGQTLLDQAEYLNEAIAYILALYHNPHRSIRDASLPDPTSVIIIGHSMGGIVARTMLTMPNYQANTINTILTLSAPHARAPVSFDAEIVDTYATINHFWRASYSKPDDENPLSHLTLVSIAGGGLDTVVPSDYASLTSLVPGSHGFTVFTSTIPHVWTGMDHLAIMWCDQFRKAVVRALYDVVDVTIPSQILPRAERMRRFRKHFLTGMEPAVVKEMAHQEPTMLLTLGDQSTAILPQGERLSLVSLGSSGKSEAHVLPIPIPGSAEAKQFTLLTDQALNGQGLVEVYFCSVYPHQAGQSGNLFALNLDFSGKAAGATRLACKSAATDAIALPASTKESNHAFDSTQPFWYLQYDIEDIVDYQFVAVIDKANEATAGWVVAEFSSNAESVVRIDKSLRSLITSGAHLVLGASRPMVNKIYISKMHSSLLAYQLDIKQKCASNSELFRPLLRQYISEPYESKFFPDVKHANINLHGVSPYVTPPATSSTKGGLFLQIWSDPTCKSSMEVSLHVDVLGSAGKLVMRYRTVFAAFPLLVVALVIRKQFKVYDATGIFMSFSEGMDQCIRTSLPVLFLALTFLSLSLAKASHSAIGEEILGQQQNATESLKSFTKNELLLGSHDSFFWFLIPLFGLICVGVCIAANYVVLALTHLLAVLYSRIRSVTLRNDEGRRTSTAFAVSSPIQRIVTTSILLLMVATIIPYQFAYMVLCLVHLATCTRALRLARETRSGTNYNFYNYTHSLLVLMLWVLPINLPVLVVWIHNLAVHWLTPFSSHHNILSIMPYILVVETMSAGHMIPRITGRLRLITNVLLFTLAIYAAVYGVTYAYVLHQLVNGFCAWLAVIHFTSSSSIISPSRLLAAVSGSGRTVTSTWQGHVKKRP
ncbi:hypothetical protein AAFC00_002240 [Neodothiora populina]|uniref:GPI inositol-deacylase n=1 Tax=Neodothiora populina TaxID=2781224 RepID=A0ABR3PGR8_9PEZI